MNLATRGIDTQIAHGDTSHNDEPPNLKADYVLATPPFNDSDWRGELLKDDKRWVYGVQPAGYPTPNVPCAFGTSSRGVCGR